MAIENDCPAVNEGKGNLAKGKKNERKKVDERRMM